MQKNIIEYLEQSALNYPDKIAYVDEYTKISFEQMRKKARALAYHFISKGIVKKNLGLLIDRSLDAIICFYACMYSNNCYVPMDLELGKARVKTIIEESELEHLLIQTRTMKEADLKEFEESYAGTLHIMKLQEIFEAKEFDDDEEISKRNQMSSKAEDEIERVLREQISTDPVYIVYTSGSSGKPKGVVANHTNVIDYIDVLGEALGFSDSNVFANQSPLYIDACIKDVFSSLKYGATNYIVPKSLFMFPVKLVEYLNEHKINTLCWVVSALSIVSTMKTFDKVKPQYVKTVAFGGERFDKAQLNTWMQALPNTKFFNLYGPTEATGMSMYYEVERPFDMEKPLYVGRAFQNTEVFLAVEDEKGVRLANTGEEGDIYIRGLCVTLGYFNDQKRSAESFVQNPLHNRYYEPVYKTGDIGYYDEYKRLVFKGRADNQIKHMGYRIELSEIEFEVSKHEKIHKAICLYHNEKIALYYMGELSEADLKKFLSESLPRYMVPNRLIKLESIPLTNSGKVDKESLKQMYP